MEGQRPEREQPAVAILGTAPRFAQSCQSECTVRGQHDAMTVTPRWSSSDGDIAIVDIVATLISSQDSIPWAYGAV